MTPALTVWLVCGLTLLALALRLRFMDVPMRGDEAWTFTAFASKPLTVGLSTYWTTNNHLLNTLLMHLSFVTLGNQPVWLRLPALFAGVLIVPASFAAGRAHYGALTGLLAAALVAPSSLLVEYSVNARGYTLLIVCFLLLLVVARRLLDAPRTGGWAAFIGLSALGFYAVPTMLYPFALVVVWLGLSTLIARRWQRLGALGIACVAAGILTLILYAPALLYLSRLDASAVTDFSALTTAAAGFYDRLGQNLVTTWADGWLRDWPGLIRIVVTVGFALGLALHRRMTRDAVPLALAAVVSLAPLILIQRMPLYARVWLFLLPLMLIVAAAGLVGAMRLIVRRPRWIAAATVLIAAVTALGLGWVTTHKTSIYGDRDTGYDMQHPARTLDYLRQQVKPGDSVIVCPTCLDVFNYYADRAGQPLDATRYLTWVGDWRPHTLPEPAPARLLLVTAYPMTPEQVAREMIAPFGLDPSAYRAPELLKTFDSNQVYLARRAR